MDNTKLIKSTKVIDKLLKILSGFLRAGIIVCAIFFVLLFIFGEKIVADSSSLEIGMLTLNLTQSAIPEFASLKWGIAAALITAGLICGILLYIVGIIRSILKPMLEGRPFEEGTADKIKKLALVSLISGFVIQVCKNVSSYALFSAYEMRSLFNESVVSGFTLNFTLDLNFVILAGIILVLSHIFRYGENLQRESDETL